MSRLAGFLGRNFERAHLPTKLAFQLVKGARILAHPVNYRRRQRAAKVVRGDSPWRGFIDERMGYATFGPETFPGTDTVVAICRNVFSIYIEKKRRQKEQPRKDFLINILDPKTLEANPTLLNFALSEPVVDSVMAYLGSVPILRGLGVYLSASNTSIESSQQFHTDYDDFHQVKYFMNVVDVDEGNGPFALLSAEKSRYIRSAVGHGWRDRRLTDKEVLDHCDPDDIVKLTGPAGSGGMVDTSNCLHYGSRSRIGMRLVFMFQYTTYPNVALDNSAYSGREGLPLYRFPMHCVADDPWRQALLSPHIARTAVPPMAAKRR